jgi:hypothetical protein
MKTAVTCETSNVKLTANKSQPTRSFELIYNYLLTVDSRLHHRSTLCECEEGKKEFDHDIKIFIITLYTITSLLALYATLYVSREWCPAVFSHPQSFSIPPPQTPRTRRSHPCSPYRSPKTTPACPRPL